MKNDKPIDLNSVSTEDLKAALAKKEAAEKKALEAAEKAYISEKDAAILSLFEDATAVKLLLFNLKQKVTDAMARQNEALEAYGKINKKSKGGFSVTHSNGDLRITRRRDTSPAWDERSTKAIALIKEFLLDTVKKRDKDLFEILMSFLEKNKAGDLEYSRVMDLLKHEDKFSDERWKEGLRLIKQSFSNSLKGYSYEFKRHNEDTNKWEVVQLNFSSI